MTILIRNCAYLIRNPAQIERGSDLLIEGSRIRTIGQNLPVPDGAEILDGSDCVVMPGLINPHTHLYQNFLKGVSSGLTLVPWCNQVLFPTVDAVRKNGHAGQKRAAYLWSALAAIEMIKGGVTSCIDMDMVYPEIIQAWCELGFRGVLAYTLSNQWVPAELRAEEETMKRKTLEFVEEFHRPGDLTTVFLAPSTLFLCTEAFLKWAGDQSGRLDLGIQIHIAETVGEVDDLLKETGRRPVEQLEQLGLLEKRLSAVHCVHVNNREMELLAKSGTNVVHCPKSNMKLADGVAPVTAMRRLGVPVSVGTDGCASNDLLDMWEEMRTALLLARVTRHDAGALTPQDAFSMGTVEAARAARLEAGELQPGKLADVVLLELKGVHLQPLHAADLVNSLVFCGKAADVRDTIIHGQVVMRDRCITRLSESDLIAEAVEAEKELFHLRDEYSPGS
jgi:5-methylthioadenosine/S-adenosylhomocysteine deaminase